MNKFNILVVGSISTLFLISLYTNLFTITNLKNRIVSDSKSLQALQENMYTTYTELQDKIEKLDLRATNSDAHISNSELVSKLDDEKEVIVYSDKGWQKSGYFVNKGDKVTINSTGLWTADKRIPVDKQNSNVKLFGWVSGEGNVLNGDWYTEYGPTMQLLGKINDTTFSLGEATVFIAPEAGELELAPNDLCCYQDNAGLLVVKITMKN